MSLVDDFHQFIISIPSATQQKMQFLSSISYDSAKNV